jgi:hypothetical protein
MLSWIRGVMTPPTVKSLTPPKVQYGVGPIFTLSIPGIVVRHPARRPSHKTPKKATANGFIPNTARARKKKRRAVDGRAKENSTDTAFAL